MGLDSPRWFLTKMLMLSALWWTSPATAEVGRVATVPDHLIDLEGNFDNNIPFSDEGPVRYQQVFLGSQLGSFAELRQIRFRQDEFWGVPFSGTIPDVTVVLSSTTAAPDGLSMTFSANLGPDATVVHSGPLLLSSAPSSAVPRPFDIVLPLPNGFVFDGTTGLNLLLDVTLAVGPELSSFDAEWTEGDAVSRVYCWTEEQCLTGNEAMIGDTVGLVTMFLEGLIFADRFESGDLSEWAQTLP